MAETAYRNKTNGEVYLFGEERPDLDARNNFERVTDAGEIPQKARDALARAEAEKASIEAAAQTRAQRVEAASVEDASAAFGLAVSTPDPTPAMTGAHLAPDVENPVEGVLARGHTPGALQIGPNPEEHPRTREELEERAARDSEDLATKGVLTRAAESRAAGGEQIGPEPGRHPRGATELLATAEAGTGHTPGGTVDSAKRPAKSAPRSEWVEHGKRVEAAKGTSRDLSDEQLEGMTAKALQDRYGA